MKTIGILGGMSPESTAEYYLRIVRKAYEHFSDHTYPQIVVWSVTFGPIVGWMEKGEWDRVADALGDGIKRLEAAGADFIIVATNTKHILIDRLKEMANVPIISILDVVADAIKAQGMKKVGLLGTRFTMEASFYQNTLGARGIEVITPDKEDRELVHRVIFDELIRHDIREDSRNEYLRIISDLRNRGAQGIILGCTEIPLLISKEQAGMPLFDTTILHADAAFSAAIA